MALEVGIIARIARRCLLLVQKVFAFIGTASAIGHAPARTKSTVVFLVGPPRSGSTLIMQVLCDAFKVGYISNQHCKWFGAPTAAERVFRPLAEKSPSDYASNHGRTTGQHAPSECGAWWYRFFQRDPAYVKLKDVSRRKMVAFRRSLEGLGKAVGRPLLFKNLYVGLRLEPISYYVPNALFVAIDRNWVDNGQSILRGRYDALGDYGQWWSVPPPDVDQLAKLKPVQQVVGQVQAIHTLINRDIERLGLEDRTFRVRYEEFCEDVHGTLAAFEAFMASHGVELERRFDVPTHFSINRYMKIPVPMYEELKAEVESRKRVGCGGGE